MAKISCKIDSLIPSGSERLPRLSSNAPVTLTVIQGDSSVNNTPSMSSPHIWFECCQQSVVNWELMRDAGISVSPQSHWQIWVIRNRQQGATPGPTSIHMVSQRSSHQPFEVLTRHHRSWFTDVCLMAQTNNILLKLNADGVINVGVRLMKNCWMEHVCTMKYSDDNTRRPNSSLWTLENAHFNI